MVSRRQPIITFLSPFSAPLSGASSLECSASHPAMNGAQPLTPRIRPLAKRHDERHQCLSFLAQAIAARIVNYDACCPQFLEARVQDPRICLGRRLQPAEGHGVLGLGKLPHNAQSHAPPQQIKKRHDRAPGLRPTDWLARFGKLHAIRFIAGGIRSAMKIIAARSAK